MFAAGLVLLWLALQLFPTSASEPPVYSDESGAVADGAQIRTNNEGPDLFSTGNMLAVIILAGGGVFAYVVQRRSRAGRNSTSLIEEIDELGVGQGQQLRLVRCGGEVLLVGVTSNQITLLREFDPQRFIAPVDQPSRRPVDDPAGPSEAGSAAPSRGHVRIRRGGAGLADDVVEGSSVHQDREAPRRSHFADVLREYAGRYVNVHSSGTKC